jgi:uncharacterized protein DUF6702
MGRPAESVVNIERLAAAMLAVGLLLGAPTTGAAHPLHTTLTEVTVDAASHSVRVVVRVFADDFGSALARRARVAAPPAGRAWDDAASNYLNVTLALADRANRPIALHSCGTRRSTDLLWICLEGTTEESPHELRGRSSILCDLFEDQVNIVEFVSGAEKHSVLFTRGDGLKRLF